MGQVAVIGLDGAAPRLVFERWHDELPNLSRLMRHGCWGDLRSVHPPITVPAWAVMFSGRDPGELGIYGFRNRRSHGYDGYGLVHSGLLPEEMVWDILGRAGKKVILLGVPPSYPPRPVDGCLVSCFLTPTTDHPYTHPASLRPEVERVAGGYVHDVADFRGSDKEALLQRIYEKTRKHFAVARHLLATRPWDLFAMVEMGVDRIQHAFWKYGDPEHPHHVAGSPFESCLRDYYRYIDDEIGSLLTLISADANVLVVSDHGARPLLGAVCFNQWLVEKGYLTLKHPPARPTGLSAAMVDWGRTRAWAEGGYYGRLFLNLRGREPSGIVAAGQVEALRDELIAALAEMEHPSGGRLGVEAHRPEDLYRECKGIPPDLMVYFGDLAWRSSGVVGAGLFDCESGADSANHDWDGLFVARCGRENVGGGRLRGLQAMDVAPTILELAGVEVPPAMQGRAIEARRQGCAA